MTSRNGHSCGLWRICALWLVVSLVVALASVPFVIAKGDNDTEDSATSVQPQSSRLRFLHRLQGLFTHSTSSSSSLLSTSLDKLESPAATKASSFSILGGEKDSWAEEWDLKLARRLLDGDHFSVLKEMVLSKDLEVIWSTPYAARRLLEANPILKMLPGAAALAKKDLEDWTPDDGLQILSRLRLFAKDAMEKTMANIDPSKSMENLEKFAHRGLREEHEGGDPKLKTLFDKVAAGDDTAAKEVHDVVFDELWGGLVDKEQMGFGKEPGTMFEPEASKIMRDYVRTQEPALWDMMTMDDPFITQLMTDPLATPMKVIQDLTNQELAADQTELESKSKQQET